MRESSELGKHCFLLCSYMVQVHSMCSNANTHLHCSNAEAGSC